MLTASANTNLGYEAQLWQMAGALRSNMNASEYKYVVLCLIFLEYNSNAIEAIHAELDHVLQTLTGRIRQLSGRYATPLPKLTDDVDILAARVAGHLKQMGAVS